MTCVRFAPSGPSLNILTVRRMDLASIVKPGIFIVDDVTLPPPITFLVLPGEKVIVAELGGGGLGLASGGPSVGRLSETGSDNDDREGQSGDERFHDTSPSIVHQRRRRRHQPSCTLSESRSGKGSLIPRLLTRDACQRTGTAHESCAAQSRPISRSNSQPSSSWSSICNLQKRSAMKFRPALVLRVDKVIE